MAVWKRWKNFCRALPIWFPTHPQSYGNIGICYAHLGQKVNALAALEIALELDPMYEPVIVNKTATGTLKEGEKLEQEQLKSVDYYKDYSSKKKSFIRSTFDGDIH